MERFDTPTYQDTWRRVYKFARYADKTNYFIEVDYFVNRDAFKSRVDRNSPPALDLTLKAENGRRIFRNLSSAVREEISTRNYVLLTESESAVNESQDMLKITETYGYAPNVKFESWEFMQVPRWGWRDHDYSVKANIVFGANNRYVDPNRLCSNVDVGTNASKFKTGDEVWLKIACQYDYPLNDIFGNWGTNVIEVESGVVKIRRIENGVLELMAGNVSSGGRLFMSNSYKGLYPKTVGAEMDKSIINEELLFRGLAGATRKQLIATYTGNSSTKWSALATPLTSAAEIEMQTTDSDGNLLFWVYPLDESGNTQGDSTRYEAKLVGGNLLKSADNSTVIEDFDEGKLETYRSENKIGITQKTATTTVAASAYVLRECSRRDGQNEFAPVRVETTYTLSAPRAENAFTPRNECGTAYEYIGEETIPSLPAWKAKCESTDKYDGYFKPEADEIEYDAELGMYCRREKYRKCEM